MDIENNSKNNEHVFFIPLIIRIHMIEMMNRSFTFLIFAWLSNAEFVIIGGNLEIEIPNILPQSLTELINSLDSSSLGFKTFQAVENFKKNSEAVAIVFKNSPLGNVPSKPGNSSMLSKWVLGTVAKAFGLPVGFQEKFSHTLFKHIYEESYVGDYTEDTSDKVFGWHVENFAHPHMPKYVLMQCLRQDNEKRVETIFLPGQSVISDLCAKSLDVLQQKRFFLTVEDTLNFDNVSKIPEAVAILSMQQGTKAWNMNLDSTFMSPKLKDVEGKNALTELLEVAESNYFGIKLEAGDIIIWDNTRAAHDRQYSGTGRWLQRIHAYTTTVTPFTMFHHLPLSFNGDEPNVIATQGAYDSFCGKMM